MDNPLSKVPIIVGVADVVNRSKKIQDAIEPAQLMLQAIQSAIQDTGLASSVSSALQSEIDSISVVRTWTWPYPDLPGLLSERLAIDPVHRVYPEQHGGNQPAALLDEAARRISKGQTKVAVVTGGEALASCLYRTRMQPASDPSNIMNSVGMRGREADATAELDGSSRGGQVGVFTNDPRAPKRYHARLQHGLAPLNPTQTSALAIPSETRSSFTLSTRTHSARTGTSRSVATMPNPPRCMPNLPR